MSLHTTWAYGRTHISYLEHGKRNVSVISLQVIARGFKMNVSEYYDGCEMVSPLLLAQRHQNPAYG